MSPEEEEMGADAAEHGITDSDPKQKRTRRRTLGSLRKFSAMQKTSSLNNIKNENSPRIFSVELSNEVRRRQQQINLDSDSDFGYVSYHNTEGSDNFGFNFDSGINDLNAQWVRTSICSSLKSDENMTRTDFKNTRKVQSLIEKTNVSDKLNTFLETRLENDSSQVILRRNSIS